MPSTSFVFYEVLVTTSKEANSGTTHPVDVVIHGVFGETPPLLIGGLPQRSTVRSMWRFVGWPLAVTVRGGDDGASIAQVQLYIKDRDNKVLFNDGFWFTAGTQGWNEGVWIDTDHDFQVAQVTIPCDRQPKPDVDQEQTKRRTEEVAADIFVLRNTTQSEAVITGTYELSYETGVTIERGSVKAETTETGGESTLEFGQTLATEVETDVGFATATASAEASSGQSSSTHFSKAIHSEVQANLGATTTERKTLSLSIPVSVPANAARKVAISVMQSSHVRMVRYAGLEVPVTVRGAITYNLAVSPGEVSDEQALAAARMS